MNDLIFLREPTAADVPQLDEWSHSLEFRGEFNDFGLPPKSAADRFESGFITETNGSLIICETTTGKPVGTIDWRPSMYGAPPESMAFQFGISLSPETRGKGYGPEAMRKVADYLFAHTKTNRVEGSCDAENVPSQRAMLKAGYVYEGTIRKAQWRRGAYHDLMYFGRLRDDAVPPDA
ncbi:MAG: GNAT family protein [bacterium]